MLSVLGPALPSLYRLVALAACAALLALEHVRLAVRAFRRGPGAGALALVLPGAGAVYAFRDGARVAPCLYAALALGYAALRLWS